MGPQRKPAPTNPHARCGAVRGWPVLSAHFRPRAAPQVGQRTVRARSGLRSFFMGDEDNTPKATYKNGQFWAINFEHR